MLSSLLLLASCLSRQDRHSWWATSPGVIGSQGSCKAFQPQTGLVCSPASKLDIPSQGLVSCSGAISWEICQYELLPPGFLLVTRTPSALTTAVPPAISVHSCFLLSTLYTVPTWGAALSPKGKTDLQLSALLEVSSESSEMLFGVGDLSLTGLE